MLRDQKTFAMGGGHLLDVIFVVVTIAFFALSLAYVEFCDRIR
jgi:hypothetical protein